MKLLFVHANFPAQYHRLVNWLLRQGGHELVAIRQQQDKDLPQGKIRLLAYPARQFPGDIHAQAAYNSAQVAALCTGLKESGFVPDAVLGHASWGELLRIKGVYEQAAVIPYFEYFQPRLRFASLFPDYPVDRATEELVRTQRGEVELQLLEQCDAGISPSQVQRQTYPQQFRDKIHVLSEGVQTETVRPDAEATVRLSFNNKEAGSRQALEFSTGTEVLTYASRFLEPARGYDKFLQALPAIQQARPEVQTLIMGIIGQHYGPAMVLAANGRPQLEQDLRGELDMNRIHFLGHVSHDIYVRIMQVSRCHIHWSVPFTLSWSLLEALSAGCRVVAADNALSREVSAEGETALLGSFESHKSLAELAIRVLENPEKYDAMAARARKRMVQVYDANTLVCPAWMALIERYL